MTQFARLLRTVVILAAGPGTAAWAGDGGIGISDVPMSGLLVFGLSGGLVAVAWAFRLVIGIQRTTRALHGTKLFTKPDQSFEDRLAERLREIEGNGTAAVPQHAVPVAHPIAAPSSPEPVTVRPPVSVAIAPTPPAGVRTFGRRTAGPRPG